MRKTIMIAVAAGSLLGAGITVGATRASAQSAPPPPPAPGMEGRGPGMREPGMPGSGMQGSGMQGPGMHGPMMRDMQHGAMGGPMHRMGGWMHRMRMFALIYPAPDRALSGPDVQKIAEAFLLFNGNHTWKVTEVTEDPNRVTFTLATPDGTAIAHFAMDRHTARLERLS